MSIQPNPNSIANEIRMMKNKKFYVLVEGNFDAKFYRQFFDKNKTIIKQCNGKENVLEVFENLKNDLDKTDVIFVLDRDFDFLLKLNIINEKIFYTDFHDLDIMLIQAESFEKFLCYDCKAEYVDNFKAKYNITELKDYIFNVAKDLGKLRLLSYSDSYNFKFRSIDFKNFINKDDLSLDIEKLIAEVKNKSQMPKLNEKEIIDKLSKISDIDLCLLNSGHDIICILSEGMKNAISKNSNNKYTHDVIQDKFLYGCNIEKFKQYNLYKDLKSYCDKTNHCLL